MFGAKKKAERNGDVNERVVSTVISPYAPRQSGRVNSHTISADNDTWVEHYAVVELEEQPHRFSKSSAATRKHVIRSFFQSRSTGRREWDEPPSGASDIQFATGEMRRMAEAQLTELELQPTTATAQERTAVPEKSKKKLWKMKRRKSTSTKGDREAEERQQAAERARRERQAQRSEAADQEYNRQVQMALALSLEHGAKHDGEAFVSKPSSTSSKYEDEIMMAKALSLSEQEAVIPQAWPSVPSDNDEDEQLRQAIERSKVETSSDSPLHDTSRLTSNTFVAVGQANVIPFDSGVEVGIGHTLNEWNNYATPAKSDGTARNSENVVLRKFDPLHEETFSPNQGIYQSPLSPVKPPEAHQTPSQEAQNEPLSSCAYSANLLASQVFQPHHDPPPAISAQSPMVSANPLASQVFQPFHDPAISAQSSMVNNDANHGARWNMGNNTTTTPRRVSVTGTGTEMMSRRECAELI